MKVEKQRQNDPVFDLQPVGVMHCKDMNAMSMDGGRKTATSDWNSFRYSFRY